MKRAGAGAVLLVLALLSNALPARAQCADGAPPPCGGTRPPRPRVQVAAFTASDTAAAYLANGIAEDVRAALLGSQQVILLGPRANVPGELVLRGDVQRSTQGIAVRARLERTSTGTVLWSRRLSRPVREVQALAAELAQQTLASAGVRAPAIRTPAVDPAVYDLYLRGNYSVFRRTAPSLARALALYREAIALDSMSELGWVGVARTLERAYGLYIPLPGISRDQMIPLLLEAAGRAAELAPGNSNVLTMRSVVAVIVDPTDSSGVLRLLRDAIAADSTNADAWRLLGMKQHEIGDLTAGRLAYRRAVALAPEDAETLGFLAISWFLDRRLDSARVWAERSVAADPTNLTARGVSGQVALWQGRLDEAYGHFSAGDRIGQNESDQVGRLELARVYVARSDTARARAYVLNAAARGDSVSPSNHMVVAMADGYLAVGDTARALWWLERYQPSRSLHFQYHLRGEPAFDGVRDHPRFRALIAPVPRQH